MVRGSGVAAILIGLALSLGGCGTDTGQAGTPRPVEVTPNGESVFYVESEDWHEVKVKLRDGRSVTCLVWNGVRVGGQDCDWAAVK